MNLSGNTVLITGGTSGIGMAFAEQFLRHQSKVIIVGRREERLKAFKNKYPHLITRNCDLTDEKQCKSLFEWVKSDYPDTNILINNAGIQLAVDLKKEVDLKNLRREIDTNLIAPIYLSSLFVQHLAQKEDAAIINVSSGLAFAPLAFMPVYCATKAAIHSFCLSQRHQLKDTSIKVFEIIPPSVDTELGHERRENKAETHGGMPVSEFINDAMKAIEEDHYEAAVGESIRLRDKGEDLFDLMNH